MITENVNLAGRSYPIFIGDNAFGFMACQMRDTAKSRRLVCVADSAVCAAYPDRVRELSQLMPIIEIPAGEKSKSVEMFGQLCSKLAALGIDRKSALLAMGGGVIGDLAGFVAAAYMRGIDFYQIPTTLLAMVDSSVGGKTAVNIPEGKNLVGAFHQPKGVFMDTEFLGTLPKREFAAGMAELIKCSLINDAEFFGELESLETPLCAGHPFLSKALAKACAMKARVVSADECETASSGGRALLNLGHTFGHAVEKCAGYGNVLHGEAVSQGIVMCMMYSRRLGLISDAEIGRVESLLEKNSLPIRPSCPLDAAAMLDSMFHDKKTRSGQLRLVLLRGIGKAFEQDGDPDLARKTIDEFIGR